MHSKYRQRQAPLFPYLFQCCFGKPKVSRGAVLKSCTGARPSLLQQSSKFTDSSIMAFNF